MLSEDQKEELRGLALGDRVDALLKLSAEELTGEIIRRGAEHSIAVSDLVLLSIARSLRLLVRGMAPGLAELPDE